MTFPTRGTEHESTQEMRNNVADAMVFREAMRIKVRKGLDLPIAGTPDQRIDAKSVGSVAAVAGDYRGLRPSILVKEGDGVRVGQPLVSDKDSPELLLTSPGCGRVVEVNWGPRRSLRSIVIRLEGDDEERFDAHDRARLLTLDRQSVRNALLSSGLWAASRTRPFGRIPGPADSPHSIFVTAIDTNPLAADPRLIIDEHPTEFSDGVAVLSRLTDGQVYVCQGPGSELSLPQTDSVTAATFEGPHPAGLPGTHIHFLDPVAESKTVWHLNYQDVIAMGVLFATGRIHVERVIALGGPAVLRPRLLRTRVGASTVDLLDGELQKIECRVISGSILGGRRAAGWARYLGPHDLQISVLREDRDREFLGWVAPGFDKYSAIHTFTSSLRPRHKFPMTTSQHGSPRAMVPIGNFERVMPLDILPAPLLKALLIRDTEAARALGCLELAEEDLALCSFVCCSKYEYGPALRENLDLIEKEG
jgi:Na+-transporting NADH:ubiquinone oxidoreductase subunit A